MSISKNSPLSEVMDLLARTNSSDFAQDLCRVFRRSGRLSPKQEACARRMVAQAKAEVLPAAEGLQAIPEMLHSIISRGRLKNPKVTFKDVRLSLCGERSQYKGDVHVAYPERGGTYYGRITQDGKFLARDAAPGWLPDFLREFAHDPAAVASHYGRTSGRCCFCGLPLKDERSKEVGYGPICADHYRLPWGAKRRQDVSGAAIAGWVDPDYEQEVASQEEAPSASPERELVKDSVGIVQYPKPIGPQRPAQDLDELFGKYSLGAGPC